MVRKDLNEMVQKDSNEMVRKDSNEMVSKRLPIFYILYSQK